MADRRRANINWLVAGEDQKVYSTDHAQLAVLMDIRDQLKTLNALFRCSSFLDIPHKLELTRRHAARIANKIDRKRGRK